MYELQVDKEETRILVLTYCKSCKLTISQIDAINVNRFAISLG